MSDSPHPLFDRDWYLQQNPDVAAAGMDPLQHYMLHGWHEGRDPHPLFDTSFYLDANPDVADAGENPLTHYMSCGWKERRSPHPDFDVQLYLERYKDVADAGIEPLSHYIKYGMSEGRSATLATSNSVDIERRKRTEQLFLAEQPPVSVLSYYHSKFSKPGFEYEEFDPSILEGLVSDVKLFAFYLPQFHAILENDQFWGTGFTEWRQLARGLPRFPGHYQPRIPRDIGHYDLTDPSVLSRQFRLARAAGIYGFAFYYYWFNGRRILHRPLEQFLCSDQLSFPFFLIWANENWTKTWDGSNSEVLLRQDYRLEDEAALLADLARHFKDRRYFRINGRPLFVIYKPSDVPDAYLTFDRWKQTWKRDHEIEPLMFMAQTFNFNDPSIFGLDGALEFPPHKLSQRTAPRPTPDAFDKNFLGTVLSYDEIISESINEPTPSYPLIKTATPSWDNDARRPMRGLTIENSTPQKYESWMRELIVRTESAAICGERIVAINAWNEWAEGAYLEPDVYFGSAYLNATARAIRSATNPLLSNQPKIAEPTSIPRVFRSDAEILLQPIGSVAVHLHIFFEDVARELLAQVNLIPLQFDLFITTDTPEKKVYLHDLFKKHGKQAKLEVYETPNIGRDIGPLLFQVGAKLLKYDFFGHFHSKKSATVDWGDRWRKFLFDNLLGSGDGISAVFRAFAEEPNLGLVYPPAYPLISSHYDWGGIKERCGTLLRHLGLSGTLPDRPSFPAGNMFWARTEALRPLLSYPWNRSDFEHELGQLQHTLPHCIERSWRYAANFSGYSAAEGILQNQTAAKQPLQNPKRLFIYVHYDAAGTVSEADTRYLEAMRVQVDKVFIVSNNAGSEAIRERLSALCDEFLARDNIGFDFAGWRDALAKIGRTAVTDYDEVIFANNSCFGPIFPLSEMFGHMSDVKCDFWGITGFPELSSSSRPEAILLPGGNIPRHLQSYFLVVRKAAISSEPFWNFWRQVQNKTDLLEVITAYEMQLTRTLNEAGFQYACYLPESFVMQRESQDPEFNALYNKPLDFMLLRSPLLKKKSWLYAPQQMIEVCKLVDEFGYYPSHLVLSEGRNR